MIPDVSSTGLNLATCLAEADEEINEAARAGDYEAPFAVTPARVKWLAAIGAVAKARRALELGSQAEPGGTTDAYQTEFQAGLALLRQGRLDLGTVRVESQAVTLPADYEQWVSLGHGGVVLGSMELRCSGVLLTEDRHTYDPADPSGVKDYVLDHRLGRVRRLAGGDSPAGGLCTATYEYFLKQPAGLQEPEYGGRSAQVGDLGRLDYA